MNSSDEIVIKDMPLDAKKYGDLSILVEKDQNQNFFGGLTALTDARKRLKTESFSSFFDQQNITRILLENQIGELKMGRTRFAYVMQLDVVSNAKYSKEGNILFFHCDYAFAKKFRVDLDFKLRNKGKDTEKYIFVEYKSHFDLFNKLIELLLSQEAVDFIFFQGIEQIEGPFDSFVSELEAGKLSIKSIKLLGGNTALKQRLGDILLYFHKYKGVKMLFLNVLAEDPEVLGYWLASEKKTSFEFPYGNKQLTAVTKAKTVPFHCINLVPLVDLRKKERFTEFVLLIEGKNNCGKVLKYNTKTNKAEIIS